MYIAYIQSVYVYIYIYVHGVCIIYISCILRYYLNQKTSVYYHVCIYIFKYTYIIIVHIFDNRIFHRVESDS